MRRFRPRRQPLRRPSQHRHHRGYHGTPARRSAILCPRKRRLDAPITLPRRPRSCECIAAAHRAAPPIAAPAPRKCLAVTGRVGFYTSRRLCERSRLADIRLSEPRERRVPPAQRGARVPRRADLIFPACAWHSPGLRRGGTAVVQVTSRHRARCRGLATSRDSLDRCLSIPAQGSMLGRRGRLRYFVTEVSADGSYGGRGRSADRQTIPRGARVSKTTCVAGSLRARMRVGNAVIAMRSCSRLRCASARRRDFGVVARRPSADRRSGSDGDPGSGRCLRPRALQRERLGGGAGFCERGSEDAFVSR